MTIKQIIDLITTDGGSLIVIIIIMTSLIQISPIKLNPWTKLAEWIGSKINKSVLVKMDDMEKKIKEVDKNLADHIHESKQKELQDTRSDILSFGSSIISGTNYTREKFNFMISCCDRYETYCKETKISNGVADATIREIRRIYSLRLAENSFLQEGGDNHAK